MIEEWKIYPKDERYEVSTYGNVRMIGKIEPRKTRLSNKGYNRINIYKDGIHKTISVHIMVLETFVPNPENKPFCNHIDADRSNNNIENLEWCTQQENMSHAYKIGNRGKGEKHGRALLSEEQAKYIKYELLGTMMQKDIARMFNVSEGAIQGIARGKNWSHI